MSKNKVDRRESSFKARDNVEIIMDKVINLAENEFSKSIEMQRGNIGTWVTNGEVAKITIEIETPFRNIEDKTIILNCGADGIVNGTSEKTWLLMR